MANRTISVAFGGHLQVAVRLLDAVWHLGVQVPNEVKAADAENGLSSAIVTLCAASLESAAVRFAYLNHRAKNDGAEPPAPPRVGSFYAERLTTEMCEKVAEVRKVRDAIVHNHLWAGDTVQGAGGLAWADGSPWLILDDEKQRQLFAVADPQTRRTHRLGLNIVPIRVWRRDAHLAFRVVIRVFEDLRAADPTAFHIGGNFGAQEYAGEYRELPDIAGMLEIPEEK